MIVSHRGIFGLINELKLISGVLFRCLKRGYCVVVGKKKLVLKKKVGTGLKNPRGGFGVKHDRDGSLAP